MALNSVLEAYDRGEPIPSRKLHPLAASDVSPFPLMWFGEIEASLDTRDFVQGLLVEQSAIVVFGESNAGKTFWATDLALHVAAGRTWRGRRVEQGGVVYAALEGGQGFRNRITAWRDNHGLAGVNIPFAAIQSGMNLLNPDADTPRLIASLVAAAERMVVPLKLVVIDTLSRALAGGNENAADDMGALVASMDAIRQATGAAVMFIHHSGKDAAKGARGHSLLRAAVDTEIEVVADGEAKTATVVKQRELPKGDVFPFTLRVVELGQNRHGDPVTSCIVEPGDPGDVRPMSPRRRLKGHNLRAYEVLTDLIAQTGEPDHAGVPPGFLSAPEAWWRERFMERAMAGAEAGTKRKTFRRAADALVERGIVGMAAGRIWLVHPSMKTKT